MSYCAFVSAQLLALFQFPLISRSCQIVSSLFHHLSSPSTFTSSRPCSCHLGIAHAKGCSTARQEYEVAFYGFLELWGVCTPRTPHSMQLALGGSRNLKRGEEQQLTLQGWLHPHSQSSPLPGWADHAAGACRGTFFKSLNQVSFSHLNSAPCPFPCTFSDTCPPLPSLPLLC